jgi:hypothetical protein
MTSKGDIAIENFLLYIIHEYIAKKTMNGNFISIHGFYCTDGDYTPPPISHNLMVIDGINY